MRLPILSLALCLPFAALSPLPAATVWQEGEAPATHSMHRHPWWFDQVKKDLLSGGDWISNFAKEEGLADYKVTIPEAGEYTLWLRANPTGTKLSWAVDGTAWTAVDFKNEKSGEQNIAADGKPDLRFIAWVKAGSVKLSAGEHTLKIRMHGTKDNHGGLDCFVLTNDGFIPNGLLKPGAGTEPGAPDEWFPLTSAEDRFSAESVIDMSVLIEAPAGKHGPVIAKGGDLVFSGRPDRAVKFWGCGANLEYGRLSREQQLQRIRYLKKFGNNVVRQHPLFDEVTVRGKIDAQRLDAYDWWFAELKKAGLYTTWSVFYHFPVSAADGYDPELFAELEPMEDGLRDTYGLITMSPKLWEIRTKVLLALLNHKNPYTGLRYADDPALLCVEYQNEDSIFFWNPLGDLASPEPKKWKAHAKRLRGRFAEWAKKKYGNTAALKKAWGKLDAADNIDAGLGLMGPWEMDESGIRGRFAGQTARAADQTAFLTEMQRGLYETCEKAIRSTGFKAQTVTTNWLAGSGLLDQANIYTDTVGSMIDRHNYAGGGAGGHGIGEGQIYADSHLGKPGSHLFSIGLKQVENKPFSMSEWTMCPPNQWKLEAAPIMAFYGMGLQGWDCSCHFAQSGVRLGDGWPRMTSYATDTPHYMGQFPALAFALHKGHLREGDTVAARRTTAAEVMSGRPAWRQDYYNGNDLVQAPGGTPQEVFAAGKVTVGFNGGESMPFTSEKWWQKDTKTIRSTTGQLTWDYGQERILVQSEKTQGIIGKAAGTINLPAVEAEVKTGFVSLLFTPLDDLPLAKSRRILVTALARDRQSGAKYSDDGTKLLATGTAPLLLEPVQANITIAGEPPQKVTPLDPAGVPKKDAVKVSGSRFTIDGRYRTYYYEVRR